MKSLVLTLVMCLVAPASWAKVYKVEKSTTVGVEATTGEVVTELIKGQLSELGHEVSDSKFDYTLKPKVLKLGDAHIVSVEKIQDGKMIYVTDLKASNADDLDLIAKRVTRAVVDETPAKADTIVGEVTDSEVLGNTKRKEVVRRFGVGFGPSTTFKRQKNGDNVSLTLNYNWEIDAKTALRLFYEGQRDFGHMGIGARYYLSPRDTSFYLGADFGYGSGAIENEADKNKVNLNRISGFSTAGTLGVQFFRTSKVSLDVGVRYATILASNSKWPGMAGLSIGILW